MKNYIGTKLVKAEPMKQGEFFSKYRKGSLTPQSVNWSEEDGYFVEYPDGYESWSPKEVFEKAYMELIVNPELATDYPSISQEMVEDFIVDYDISTKQDKITIVVATLANGFTIVESSSCVSPENYSEEVGTLICKENIEKKVWAYLGFLLQTAVNDLDPSFLYKETTFKDRLREEFKELSQKIYKLDNLVNSLDFETKVESQVQRDLLKRQLNQMCAYRSTLELRLHELED